MSFGGYNPSGSGGSGSGGGDLPFTTAGGAPSAETMRSRASSFSSVHSNQGIQAPPPQRSSQVGQPPSNPYHYGTPSSQPGSPGGASVGLGLLNTTAGAGSGAGGYDGYGSGASSPMSASSYQCPTPPLPIQQRQQHQQQQQSTGYGHQQQTQRRQQAGSGYNSGYDSPTGMSSSLPYSLNYNNEFLKQQQQQQQQQQRYQPRPHHHSRTHSNASETSLNIDTNLGGMDGGDNGGVYSPGPASLSSASSSRRGSMSDTGGGIGSGGGFFSRKKTFRPNNLLGHEADLDDDDPYLSSSSTGSRGSSYQYGGHGQQQQLHHHGYPNQSISNSMGNHSPVKGPRRLFRTKRSNSGSSTKKGRRGSGGGGGVLNDWDLLLPSADPYEDQGEDDDEDEYQGMNENEKWKKRQLMRRGWESRKGQGIILGVLATLAVFVRIWKLAVPAAVVFDEQHFGGFTTDYIKGEFFMDVHPPLGKLLFTSIAYLLGFDGKFNFVLGRLYSKNVPYIGMRLFAAACGVGLVPISYLTIKRSGHSTQSAILCALMITFENALITQSRFILLDAPMMLFMGYTMLAWINFYNHRNRPFTRGWWTWLVQTGLGLFLSSSVKWVGLFTIATVGVCVLKYLQESRTHLYISTREFSKQFMALFVCLLVLPAVLYVGLYAIDFQLLYKSGSGNSWVSPQFQMTLKGHDVQPVMADIAWESKVHIRHANTNGGWMHSMPGEYARSGTIDQAIQLVEWDDDLTCWQIRHGDLITKAQQLERKKQPVAFDGYIYDGDLIRLKHCYSKVGLATNDLESIGSNKSFIREVRGIKWTKQPTEETVWRVELVSEGVVPGLADEHGVNKEVNKESKDPAVGGNSGGRKRDQGKQWHAIKGFRLFNEKLNCYLVSHKVFRATYSTYQEVGCIQGGRQKANTIFIVDQNVNPKLPASTPSLSYQPLSFFQKFLELNRVMWWTHHDLSSPIHGEDLFSGQASAKKTRDDSRPWSWPFLNRGLNYYSSKETNNYVYLMGNPALWWAASATAMIYMAGCVWSVLGYLRGTTKINPERERFGLTPFYTVASGTFYAGWAIHFVPFFFMDRQLYLHHYLPALYFSILLLVSRLDRTFQRWSRTRPRMATLSCLMIVGVLILSWHCLAPLAYGSDFSSRSKCEKVRSLGGWEFVCQRQNLAWARPQAAKVVVERRLDHERHAVEEEAENAKFYYQDPSSQAAANVDDQQQQRHADVIDHGDGDYGVGEDSQEHDPSGPYNLDESEHYEHEHFHHPHGASGHGHSHHGHGHEYHNADLEATGVQQARQAHVQAQQSEEHAQKQQQQQQPPPPVPEAIAPPVPVETAREEYIRQHDPERDNRQEQMMSAALERAKELQERQALLAEKQALEAKHRDLEMKLEAQAMELEEERMIHAEFERLQQVKKEKAMAAREESTEAARAKAQVKKNEDQEASLQEQQQQQQEQPPQQQPPTDAQQAQQAQLELQRQQKQQQEEHQRVIREQRRAELQKQREEEKRRLIAAAAEEAERKRKLREQVEQEEKERLRVLQELVEKNRAALEEQQRMKLEQEHRDQQQQKQQQQQEAAVVQAVVDETVATPDAALEAVIAAAAEPDAAFAAVIAAAAEPDAALAAVVAAAADPDAALAAVVDAAAAAEAEAHHEHEDMNAVGFEDSASSDTFAAIPMPMDPTREMLEEQVRQLQAQVERNRQLQLEQEMAWQQQQQQQHQQQQQQQ